MAPSPEPTKILRMIERISWSTCYEVRGFRKLGSKRTSTRHGGLRRYKSAGNGNHQPSMLSSSSSTKPKKPAHFCISKLHTTSGPLSTTQLELFNTKTQHQDAFHQRHLRPYPGGFHHDWTRLSRRPRVRSQTNPQLPGVRLPRRHLR
jgi:hypothetical protein